MSAVATKRDVEEVMKFMSAAALPGNSAIVSLDKMKSIAERLNGLEWAMRHAVDALELDETHRAQSLLEDAIADYYGTVP